MKSRQPGQTSPEAGNRHAHASNPLRTKLTAALTLIDGRDAELG